MIELCCEYLSVRCVWLYAFPISRTHDNMNPHSLVNWMSRNSLPKAGTKAEEFKGWQLDSNPQPLSSQTNTRPFRKTGYMIELRCEYLSVLCIWLYFLSCHVRVSVWIHTWECPEYQRTPRSKQVQILKFKWLQLDSNPQPFSSWTNTQQFTKTAQIIKPCCEYSSVLCIRLHVFLMSRTRFRVKPHSIVCWMWRNSFLKAAAKSEV